MLRVQIADRVAQRCLAAVADVQRAGRVGGDELDQHLVAFTRIAAAESRAGRTDLRHQAVPGGGGEVEIDEAGAGDFGLGDQG